MTLTPQPGPSTPAPAPLDITIVVGSAADRHGTELVLRSWGHRVVGRASNAKSALDLIGQRRPQVALVGNHIPDGGGTDLVRRLLAADAGLGVVLMLEQPGIRELEEAMACGANGIVLRSGSVDELASAVSAASDGGRYVAPGVGRLAQELAPTTVCPS